MLRRYATVDVFTDRLFGGNPLAVVLDGDGLSTTQMQSIAAEFNYSETTFVLPPRDLANTARVRIFTPRTEVPFAGHPNVGTAFVLARQRAAVGGDAQAVFVFEETAGLVPVLIHREDGIAVGAELTAPEPLTRRSVVSVEVAAACLSLQPGDISDAAHVPIVVSVGLPFLVVEVTSREALRRAKPDISAHQATLPRDGAESVFAYTREQLDAAGSSATVLHARMFAPLDGVLEDSATGSATAATIALRAELDAAISAERNWRVHQGEDMGRPSLLLGRTLKRDGQVVSVHVGGSCVAVMEGSFTLQGAEPASGA